MLFKDKVAIVSGVGAGLGGETALLLAREGADVVLGARTPSKLEEFARLIEAMGRKALAVPTDITREEDARNIAERTMERFGRIDVLINNAGWTGAYEPLADIPVAEWRANVDGNLIGTMAPGARQPQLLWRCQGRHHRHDALSRRRAWHPRHPR